MRAARDSLQEQLSDEQVLRLGTASWLFFYVQLVMTVYSSCCTGDPERALDRGIRDGTVA